MYSVVNGQLVVTNPDGAVYPVQFGANVAGWQINANGSLSVTYHNLATAPVMPNVPQPSVGFSPPVGMPTFGQNSDALLSQYKARFRRSA